MRCKDKIQQLINQINEQTLGIKPQDVTQDTSRAFILKSYRASDQQFFQIYRNNKEGSEHNTIFIGTPTEVFNYAWAMIEGLALANEKENQ